MTCDICGGSGYIRMPRRHKLSVRPYSEPEIPFDIVPSYGEYTCPECKSGVKIGEDHVRIICAEAKYTTHYKDEEGYRDHLKRAAEREIAHELGKAGCVNFVFKDIDRFTGQMTASIGVVSADFVADINRRAEQKLPAVLEDIGQAAAEKISNWGSHYTSLDGPISKDMAIRFMREAFADGVRKMKESRNERA